MRYVFWKHHTATIRHIIVFIMGIYLGFFICLYFHGEQLDQLMEQNEQLSISLKDTNKELEIYKQEQKQRKIPLIKSIKFHFTEKVDPFIETELLKTLMNETYFLIGKKVDDVIKSPEFIYQLLNNKTFQAKEKHFKITIKIISIHSTTEVWLTAKEVKQ